MNNNQLTIYEKQKKKEYFKRYYQLHREKLLENAKERNAKLNKKTNSFFSNNTINGER